MRNRMWIGIALLLVVSCLLLTASCAKKQVTPVEPAVSAEDEEAARLKAEAERKAAEEARLLREQELREEAARKEREAREQMGSEDVYFEFDSAVLSYEAQTLLKKKAQWLKANSGERAVIEGHCDERGTNEYNLALGDRRAESAKTFLVNLGVSASRLTTVSYGEERPVATGTTERAYAKNRRAHFVLK